MSKADDGGGGGGGVKSVDEHDKMLSVGNSNGVSGSGNVGGTDDDSNVVFKVYPERWWLLLTVVLLNLENYSHWVAFPSIAKNAAKYYDQVSLLPYTASGAH